MMALNPPFLINENLVQPIGTPNPVFQLKNGFPQLSSTINLANLQLRVQNPHQPTSYVEQVSFGPEIQITESTVLDDPTPAISPAGCCGCGTPTKQW